MCQGFHRQSPTPTSRTSNLCWTSTCRRSTSRRKTLRPTTLQPPTITPTRKLFRKSRSAKATVRKIYSVAYRVGSPCHRPKVAFLNVSLNFDVTIDKKFPRVCRTTLLSRKDISFVAGTIFFCLLHVKIVTFSFLTLV